MIKISNEGGYNFLIVKNMLCFFGVFFENYIRANLM